MFPWYWDQSIDMHCELIHWFLFDLDVIINELSYLPLPELTATLLQICQKIIIIIQSKHTLFV